jgi:hypothetical protein
MRSARALLALTVAVCAAAAPLTSAGAATGAATGDRIRADQVAYPPGEGKHAYLMTAGAARAARFTVTDARGQVVLTGAAGRDLGRWNAAYPHVYDLDLTKVDRPGRYRVSARGVFAGFVVGSPATAASAVVTFFRGQRDGADVSAGALGRGPSHLTDRRAALYDWPKFAGPDTDEIKGGLKRIGGTADVEGGWFDAGDYLKFTHILAYVDTLMLAAERDGGKVDPRLPAEAQHGLKYLDKMWDESSKTLYIQVGIGSGNGKFAGDHDVWRLPEADDHDSAAGHRYLRNRPVFRAAPPGRPISPNLAGRTAAAFAVAAQLEPDLDRAGELLDKAAEIYGLARTTGVKRLVTSLPFAFYPETAWRDDMELGGAELALAAARLGDGRRGGWVRQAARWAHEYLAHEAGGDTFNLYDVSALAHADLVRAMRAGDAGVSGLAVAQDDLTADLKAQLKIGAGRAAKDPFRAGADYAQFDAVSHAFGLTATARLYTSVTGDRSYDGFAARQRDWVFGANAWGVSFVVGTGTRFPRCPHHQIANIGGRVLTGAVVNGPNSRDLFSGGLDGYEDGMRHCPGGKADPYAAFTGHGSRFVDDTRSWQTAEPAIDFAATALYALTLSA